MENIIKKAIRQVNLLIKSCEHQLLEGDYCCLCECHGDEDGECKCIKEARAVLKELEQLLELNVWIHPSQFDIGGNLIYEPCRIHIRGPLNGSEWTERYIKATLTFKKDDFEKKRELYLKETTI